MKKSISLVLAVVIALVAALSISVMVFADDTDTSSSSAAAESSTAETRKANDRDDTSKAETTTSTGNSDADALISQIAKIDEAIDNAASNKNTTTLPNSAKEDDAETVTLAPGQTAFVNDDTTAAAAKTTKAPAVVSTYVPNTGSGVVVPAVAVLALLAGTVAVVAVKKEEK